eukprot:TRINITY_DN0_c608_g1_i4.p1 TRINITY_DN0_c608_g1~~TRINITY_DN0_c608_g1_i4.p1  ORF type:complete len:271 (+),score=98.09 TRINITY_DN0_c608_g1_i4:90-902(+)
MVQEVEFEINTIRTNIKDLIFTQLSRRDGIRKGLEGRQTPQQLLDLFKEDKNKFEEAAQRTLNPMFNNEGLSRLLEEFEDSRTNLIMAVHPGTIKNTTRSIANKVKELCLPLVEPWCEWYYSDAKKVQLEEINNDTWKYVSTRELQAPFTAKVKVGKVAQERSIDIGLIDTEYDYPRNWVPSERLFFAWSDKQVFYSPPKGQATDKVSLAKDIPIDEETEFTIKVDETRRAEFFVGPRSVATQQLTPEMKLFLYFGANNPSAEAQIISIQ